MHIGSDLRPNRFTGDPEGNSTTRHARHRPPDWNYWMQCTGLRLQTNTSPRQTACKSKEGMTRQHGAARSACCGGGERVEVA
jgi:hypothetical protein